MKIRPLSAIKKVILHCSDTSDQNNSITVDWIRRVHKTEKGFDDVGYHFFIRRSGQIEIGRPLEYVGAHCAGENFDSIGVCMAGRKEFTREQFEAVRFLADQFREEFCLTTLQWFTHNHYNPNKLCPGFSNEKLRTFWEVASA
jgi:N-acetylmuramoyl-L-alanine amidase